MNHSKYPSTRPNKHDDDIITAVAMAIAKRLNHGGSGNEDDMAEGIAEAIKDNPGADGYELARKLDDNGWIEVDFSMCEELDGVFGEMMGIVREKTKEWVGANGIKPKNNLGDLVEITQGGRQYNGEIIQIYADQAEYVVNVPDLGHIKDGLGTHGCIIKFEDMHELSADPKDFSLATQ